MNDTMEHAWLYFLHLHSGCTSLLGREDYLVGVSALGIMVLFLRVVVMIVVGFMVVLLGFLAMFVVMFVVVRLASASRNSGYEDY